MINAPPASTTHFSPTRKLRLAYFVSHPIQYQAPFLKLLAQQPDIHLEVFFASDSSVRGALDPEFGVPVLWDTALLDGYSYHFLPVLRALPESATASFARPLNYGIKKAIHRGSFDAVWIHGYHSLTHLRAIRGANSLRIPVFLRTDSTLHDRPRSDLKLAAKSFFFKALRPRITACLAVGQDNDDYWRHYFGEAFPIFPCVYAVDNDFFRRACAAASIHREELRSSLHLDPARPIILFAAKLIPRKRCADLLEAYFELCNSISPQVRPYLLVIGDGNERTTLEARVRQVSAEDVRFLGFRNQTELPRFYDLCNVFVLPSIHEPWGLAINEAMNAGRPVVVSDQVGCLRDLVHPGINGAVFPAMNIHALAESLRALLNNSATLKTMGSESLRLVAGYSFQQNIAGLRKALHAFCPALQSLNRGYFHE